MRRLTDRLDDCWVRVSCRAGSPQTGEGVGRHQGAAHLGRFQNPTLGFPAPLASEPGGLGAASPLQVPGPGPCADCSAGACVLLPGLLLLHRTALGIPCSNPGLLLLPAPALCASGDLFLVRPGGCQQGESGSCGSLSSSPSGCAASGVALGGGFALQGEGAWCLCCLPLLSGCRPCLLLVLCHSGCSGSACAGPLWIGQVGCWVRVCVLEG